MEKMVKEAAHKYNFISREEYFKLDLESDNRIEYYDGLILAMEGASFSHNSIERNLIVSLGIFLKGNQCQILPSHMRVCNPSKENYLYPDATVVCGKPELEPGVFDTLTNPSIIFEILSPSTKDADKRRKFFFYMQIPALKEYIMIDSQSRYIIISRKQPDGSWKFEELHEDASSLLIQTINFNLPLSELYEGTGL